MLFLILLLNLLVTSTLANLQSIEPIDSPNLVEPHPISTSGTNADHPDFVQEPTRSTSFQKPKVSKRLLWLGKNRRFVLPTGTLLTLQPKITLPVFRNKPFGGALNSDIQATWYFYMYFDKMGMTSDDHIWPIRMPPFYPFGDLMVRRNETEESESMQMSKEDQRRGEAVRMASESINNLRFRNRRIERSIMSLPPPENVHGGERAMMFPRIEYLMGSMGLEGRQCLLRAICEIHEYPLEHGYGFFGEVLTLFFSISKSRYAHSHMPEYLKAEKAGKLGNCNDYVKDCPKSIFYWENKYSSDKNKN